MKLHIVAVGRRVPGWVAEGYRDFARRMPAGCALHLIEVPSARRSKTADLQRLLAQEGERVLEAVPRGALPIALDVKGELWSTEQLIGRFEDWLRQGRDPAFLIGGADGLAPACLDRAAAVWSLSPLTLPHALVRVVLAEQLYRVWSACHGHPYHRH